MFRGGQAVGDIYAAFGDGRAAVPVRDFSAPADWQLLSGKFFEDVFFVPGAVAVGTAPLGPVRCVSRIVNAEHD